MDQDFEKLIKEQCDNNSSNSFIALSIIFIITIAFLYLGIRNSDKSFIIIGAGFLFMGGLFYLMLKKRIKNDGDYWVNVLKDSPNSVLWVKPVLVKEYIGLIIPISETKIFQICTSKDVASIKCESTHDLNIFLNGIKKYIPDSHIGYTPEINSLYMLDSENFIQNLKDKHLYIACSSLEIKID